jgi:hypothetical protein
MHIFLSLFSKQHNKTTIYIMLAIVSNLQIICFETRSHCEVQAGLKLTNFLLQSPRAVITGMYYHTKLGMIF